VLSSELSQLCDPSQLENRTNIQGSTKNKATADSNPSDKKLAKPAINVPLNPFSRRVSKFSQLKPLKAAKDLSDAHNSLLQQNISITN
jgi:hypothetical protein